MFNPFKWFSSKEVTNDNSHVEQIKRSYLDVTPWLRIQIGHMYRFDGDSYYVVQIMNTAFKNGWQEFSPRFETSDLAHNYLNHVLMPFDDLGKRRIAFFESLQRNSRHKHVESLYYYVRDMFDYFKRCPVVDRENIEIQFMSQMDDMGDEYFDCIYNVKNELFKNKTVGDDFKIEYRPLCGEQKRTWPGAGMMMKKYDDGRDYGNEHRHYINIGSNHQEPLRVYFKFNLNNIEIEKVPDYEN